MKRLASQFTSNYSIWLTGLLMIVYFAVYPFHKGLLYTPLVQYEGAIYGAFIFICVLGAVFAFTHFSKLHKSKGLVSLAILLLPLCYWIAQANAASAHNAGFVTFIYLAYAILFLVAVQFAGNELGRKFLSVALVGSGFIIVLFGFLNYFGNATLWGLFSYAATSTPNRYALAVEFGASGLRLNSIFQYSNSYASFLIGMFFVLISFVTHTKNRYVTLVSSFLLVPVFLSLLLTQSRGAYLVLPIVAILYMCFMKISKQIVFVLTSLLTAIASLVLYDPIFQIGAKAFKQFEPLSAVKGWTFLIGGSITISAIALLIRKFVEPSLETAKGTWMNNRLSGLLVPIIAIVLLSLSAFLIFGNKSLVTLLPGPLAQRIESINLQQHSILERGTFYSDGFKVVKDYPVIGAGGGSWPALYHAYQNNPYVSSDIHSFYLQHLIDTGILGFVALLLILLFIVWKFIHSQIGRKSMIEPYHLAAWSMFLSLAFHSAIDLDMSFMFIGSLFFVCLGSVVSSIDFDFKLKSIKESNFSRILASFLIVISIVFAFISLQKLSAYDLFVQHRKEAGAAKQDFAVVDTSLKKTIKKDPGQPVYQLERVGYLTQGYKQTQTPFFYDEAAKMISRLKSREPYNIELFQAQYNLLQTAAGKDEETIQLIESALPKFPWDIRVYDQAFYFYYQLGQQAAGAGNTTLQQQYWDKIRNLDKKIQANIDHLATLPQGQQPGEPYVRTQQMTEILNTIK